MVFFSTRAYSPPPSRLFLLPSEKYTEIYFEFNVRIYNRIPNPKYNSKTPLRNLRNESTAEPIAAASEEGGGFNTNSSIHINSTAGKKKKGLKAKSAKMIPLELQRLFARLQLLDTRTVSTEVTNPSRVYCYRSYRVCCCFCIYFAPYRINTRKLELVYILLFALPVLCWKIFYVI